MSGWIYSGTLPSLEDKTRYTSPPDYDADEIDGDHEYDCWKEQQLDDWEDDL